MSARIPPPMYRVKIERHAIPPRYLVPARTCKLPAVSPESACEQVVLWAHADASVPPWRPFVRLSLSFATAEPVGTSRESWERIAYRKRRAA